MSKNDVVSKAAASFWEENPALRAIAAMNRSWEENPVLKAIAAMNRSLEESPALKAIAAMTRSWEGSPALKAIAEMTRSWEGSPALKTIAEMNRSWEESPTLKAMEAASGAWISSPSFKAAVAAAQTLQTYPRMEMLARSGLSLERWGVSDAVTVDAVLDELATRVGMPLEQSDEKVKSELSGGENHRSLEMAEFSSAEVVPESAPSQFLNRVPTWALFFWLYIVAPMVFVVVNWESARAALVDLNARLPQVESFVEIRNFVRTELAGKPGDIRLVKGENARLREGPGTKFDVILILPPDAPVVVLGKEDRTWLYVSYEHQGYMIDGYISTKRLRKVRK